MAVRLRRTAVALLAVCAIALAACTPDGEAPPTEKTVTSSGPRLLTFSVYGPAPVVTAYTKIAAAFTAKHPDIVVNVRPYDTHDEALQALDKLSTEGNPPDLFVVSRSDLPKLQADKSIQRVDELLGKRHIDFGDGYQRAGLEAFSADAALQCMPTDISPMVVYYNTRLVDIGTLRDSGRKPIEPGHSWTMEEFVKAAQSASHGRDRGVYVAPDLEQVAPFIWSGGGEIVDDSEKPTKLTLSSGSSQSALEQLLELVRNPRVTFNQAQLATASALQRFKAGHLGMILGFRDLTPELRAQQELSFDVMPLPKIGTQASIGQMSGLCISKATQNAAETADFLAYLVSDEAQETLAGTGYVMPSNLAVLNSDAFLQPDEQPVSTRVFTSQVRGSRSLPDGDSWPAVRDMAAQMLTQLFYQPVIDPLEERLKVIDAASEPLFTPPSPSPSPSNPSTAAGTPSPDAATSSSTPGSPGASPTP